MVVDGYSLVAHAVRREKEAMIVVMGVTGSGKSSFISQVVGRDVGIGHDLGSRA